MPVTLGAQPRAPLSHPRTAIAAQSADWMDAARLVRRTGFGATGAQVDAALRLGTDGYVTSALRPIRRRIPGRSPRHAGVRAHPAPGKDADPDVRKAARKQLRAQLKTLVGWWIRRMAAVEHPFTEKITFCWHNHFATAATQGADRRRDGSARTRRCARSAPATSAPWRRPCWSTRPCCSGWTGRRTSRPRANENLSREFMELFALGHGDGYTETDVREGARALTGWRIGKDGTVRLRKNCTTGTRKTVLGVTGDLDQVGFL